MTVAEDTPKQVVVVGGGPVLCDRLRQSGAQITMVDTPAGYDPSLVSAAVRTVLAEYDDPTLIPLLRALHEQTPFTAVLSLTEQGLLPAARMAAELGIPGLPPDVVARTRDKAAMRAWLRDQGFSEVPAAIVRDAADIRGFADEHGYPVIVKPRHGQGSDHVACFRRAEEVVTPPAIADDYLAEAFLPGPEVSVEAHSCAGEHHVIAITAKLTNDEDEANPFVEIGHLVPAPLDPADTAAVTAYVTGFLDAMGITDGPSHTELRLTPAGPAVVETHTRVGGDSIPTLVRQATGHDLIGLLVQWALDRTRPGEPEPTLGRAAAIRFFTPPPGRVRSVTGVPRFQGLPGVLRLHLPLKAGDRIAPVADSRTRAGYVLAVSTAGDRAVDLCRRVISGVQIDVG